MKKTLLTLGVGAALVCCSLAIASTVTPGASRQAGKELEVSPETLNMMNRQLPSKPVQQRMKAPRQGVEVETVSVWNPSELVFGGDGSGSYSSDTNVFTTTVQVAGQGNFLYSVVDDDFGMRACEHPYTFTGKISTDGDADVLVAIMWIDGRSLYARNSAVYTLDESNGRTADFDISTSFKGMEGTPLAVMFRVNNISAETTLTCTDLDLSYSFEYVKAEEWTEDTALPGLDFGSEAMTEFRNNWGATPYVVRLADGVTTLGLMDYNGELHVAGINTTAMDIDMPQTVSINGEFRSLPVFGFDDDNFALFQWGEFNQALKSITMTDMRLQGSFENSSVTDIWFRGACSVSDMALSYSGWYSGVTLHLPMNHDRTTLYGYGFKRVLVGNELPEYPEPGIGQWVMPGENEGEYFGMRVLDGYIYVVEVISDKEAVLLPTRAEYNGAYYLIAGAGAEDRYGDGSFLAMAPNLKSLTFPQHYLKFGIYWNDSTPITDLYVSGSPMEIYSDIPSNVNIHISDKNLYAEYESNSQWNQAVLMPDGWEFEKLIINVARRGEFAQTYIEQTDANWELARDVKVTGRLDETDLKNMKNMVNLRTLDLSEAEFDALPSRWMTNMYNITSVVLPETLAEIPSEAFRYCENLREVKAPNVTAIRNSAFQYCRALKSFDLSKVAIIEDYAFYNANLSEVTFAGELAYLGASSFYGNTMLKEAVIPDGIRALGNNLFQGCSSLAAITLPTTLTAIGSEALRGTAITGLDVPEGVTSIGSAAFSNCRNLETLTLPSTLNEAGSYMVENCESLKNVYCKAVIPPTLYGSITSGVDLNHCALWIAPFSIQEYRNTEYWNNFFIMKALTEPISTISIDRPMTFDLQSEDNAVLENNPRLYLRYGDSSHVGQLTAEGDGTLSAGYVEMWGRLMPRTNSGNNYSATLINNAENMRADEVCLSLQVYKNYWNFFSLPFDVKVADITANEGTDFVIRRYDSAKRAAADNTAGSNWIDVAADETLVAGQGYIIMAANNLTDSNGYSTNAFVRFNSGNTLTKNNIFRSANCITELKEYPAEFAHNRSWNFVGNPYPCYYRLNTLMEDFYQPVTIWRGTSYQAYSPIDDDVILRPYEAFFVQCPLENNRMVFNAEGRMHYAEAYNATYSSASPGMRAPKLDAAGSSRAVFDFKVEGASADDRARVVMNEAASRDYEIECDAAKMFSESAAGIEVYANEGVLYSICERPLADGLSTLGIRAAVAGEYTLSVNGRNTAGWKVILTDNLTGATVDITSTPYVFTTETGDFAQRFTLRFMAPDTNGVDTVPAADEHAEVFTLDGIKVFEGNFSGFTGAKGIYLVVSGNRAYKVEL